MVTSFPELTTRAPCKGAKARQSRVSGTGGGDLHGGSETEGGGQLLQQAGGGVHHMSLLVPIPPLLSVAEASLAALACLRPRCLSPATECRGQVTLREEAAVGWRWLAGFLLPFLEASGLSDSGARLFGSV